MEGYETVLVKKDGTRVDVSLTVSPIRDPMGEIMGVSTIARDITRNKWAEINSKTSEIRYRRLFETAKDGILLLDAETGQIIDVNPFLIKLLDYSHDEFLGKKLWDIGLLRDVQECLAGFLKAAGERIYSLRESAACDQGWTEHRGRVCEQCLFSTGRESDPVQRA